MASKGKAKPAGRPRKKANGYAKSMKIPLGTVITDLEKKRWLVGPSIGSGGFGDIYSCCLAEKAPRNTNDYQQVLKIEPIENGPLFVEMHFYIRNTKNADIEAFKKARKIKNLGIPCLLGNGSEELQGEKHRFVVIPRYGSDIWKMFINNGRQIPQHTVYRLAIQMLDVLEYIHGTTYIHGDLKGANILLGSGKGGDSQVYLVDFGLASHYTTNEFKPNPKQMHNGTIEYTSRDAHLGVPTRRSDLEILGYNLIQWSASKLPWEAPEILKVPLKVQEAKEKFMKDVEKSLKELFGDMPRPLANFMVYVKNLKHDEKPDYDKCREMFEKGLKALGKTNSGDLEFAAKAPALKKDKKEAINTAKRSPVRGKDTESVSPVKRARTKRDPTPPRNASPSPKRKVKPPKAKKEEAVKPISKTKKLYKVNVELDISLDADVLVNVQRKPKAVATRKSPRATVSTPRAASEDECIPETPEVSPRKRRAAKTGKTGKTRVLIHKEI